MNSNFNNIHIIAIGGAVMSSLGIALKKSGAKVTGSDDKIYDPALSNLQQNNLLPAEGWDEANIHKDLDTVIVGMHAKADNPELKKAQDLGLTILSYPEFIRSQSEHKQRIVIAGSHGKTTITGMIVHVLNYLNKPCDYLLGAKIKGIDNTIQLSNAPIIVIEGDEYFTSPLDQSPKFLKYDHHIALISGTEWDHINVYPTADSYIEQFELLADSSPKAGSLLYCEDDRMAMIIGSKERDDVRAIPYKTPKYKVKNGQFILDGEHPLKVFGKHNMQNLEGARKLLDLLGVTDQQFYEAIQSYEGAEKRNNLVQANDSSAIYSDFAHAPSKVKATVHAVNELHPDRKLTACFELHTFSSLNKEYLPNYADKMKYADTAIVYYNKATLEAKGDTVLSTDELKAFFNEKNLLVFTDSDELKNYLNKQNWKNHDLLMMSSGNFGGLNLSELADNLLS
ncbi:UDP-N-acetylmuramate: L-alanyl-gamma-D-glutamyl-meso-diaminopimelate ligase [Reichenbachiella agariperforans]|uniref:UDP-N-acetylmuramate: L-alanyl-gamma-D-glutamyl-meso-diaminopimelate ligase n=1 Tax=Reichenbachiella agariperforans TaxID=156994 RepID=A0A1M6KHB6_REIAG|nr:Mur ligase domain-containing protein [Reichenbachiella agariperforans]SHJ58373.1 UDP-N-acetylmuramate: L-alanyl-gamma-D-glutamyl-meso-diaminopimelate ligase [Reichenbachiella agariperforans]